ncbi:hypothetical protein AOQ84DRAFT_380886 [Glonium stellatum]|uniref:Homeobox domain-containing protein n=1 Tax=Glonium stellatum TaxID=574774 RepID=A0A8E2ESP0_9PEZI|nr:hypothetical protein AOQ84DRAFT_380886 [Glonium stellatum]
MSTALQRWSLAGEMIQNLITRHVTSVHPPRMSAPDPCAEDLYRLSSISLIPPRSEHWADDQAYDFKLSNSDIFNYAFSGFIAKLEPNEIGVSGFYDGSTAYLSLSLGSNPITAPKSDYDNNALQDVHHASPLTSNVFGDKEFNGYETPSVKPRDATFTSSTGACFNLISYDEPVRATCVQMKDLELDVTSSYPGAIGRGTAVHFDAASSLELNSLPTISQAQINSIESANSNEQPIYHPKTGQKDIIRARDEPQKNLNNVKSIEASRFSPVSPSSLISTNSRVVINAKSILSEGAGRGLLNEWFNTHQKFPYPTSEEELSFMNSTSLTLQQIRTYYTNQRARKMRRAAKEPPSTCNITNFSSQSLIGLPSSLSGLLEESYHDNHVLEPTGSSGPSFIKRSQLSPFSAGRPSSTSANNDWAVNEESVMPAVSNLFYFSFSEHWEKRQEKIYASILTARNPIYNKRHQRLLLYDLQEATKGPVRVEEA